MYAGHGIEQMNERRDTLPTISVVEIEQGVAKRFTFNTACVASATGLSCATALVRGSIVVAASVTFSYMVAARTLVYSWVGAALQRLTSVGDERAGRGVDLARFRRFGGRGHFL
jgi:hypothetical protein